MFLGAIRNGNLLQLKAMAEPEERLIFKVDETVEVRSNKPLKEGGTGGKWLEGVVKADEEGKYRVLLNFTEEAEEEAEEEAKEEARRNCAFPLFPCLLLSSVLRMRGEYRARNFTKPPLSRS